MTQNSLADKHSASHIALPNRGLLRLSGRDKVDFLQGLITQDATLLKAPGDIIYALLLTPQGKFLHDFFVIVLWDGDFLIDCEAARREDLRARLWRYRLRAQIVILDETPKWRVEAELPPLVERRAILSYADPRSPLLGRRHYVPTQKAVTILPSGDGEVGPPMTVLNDDANLPPGRFAAYEKIRLTRGIPDGSRDMTIEKSLPMEFNCDKFKGVALNKGCYLGQEMTSRMFFRDLIKKQTYPAQVALPKGAGMPPPGTPILADGEPVGELRTSVNDIALAYVRIAAAEKMLTVDNMSCTIVAYSLQ